jgi:predicted kinase
MEAVIFIGIQGSGKSTFYRDRFFETHVRISLDLLKTRSRQEAFLRTCLQTGQRFVIDNTNARAAERARYIDAAKAAGFRVIGYFFDARLRDALRRNKLRSGRAVIPVAGVIATLKRLERPKPQERFDELYVVSRDEHDDFVVASFVDESTGRANGALSTGETSGDKQQA